MKVLTWMAIFGLCAGAHMSAEAQTEIAGASGVKWKEGPNFDVLSPARPSVSGSNKIEVVEFFWYGCPHCYVLEPALVLWSKRKPGYVEFVRIPDTSNPERRAHAQLYYALEVLGRNDLDGVVFDCIERQGNRLFSVDGQDATFRLQLDFAKEHGISERAFTEAYRSPQVTAALDRVRGLEIQYHIEGVPTVVVGGVYKSTESQAGGAEKLFQLVNDLSAHARESHAEGAVASERR